MGRFGRAYLPSSKRHIGCLISPCAVQCDTDVASLLHRHKYRSLLCAMRSSQVPLGWAQHGPSLTPQYPGSTSG